jgi:hypothetical protein
MKRAILWSLAAVAAIASAACSRCGGEEATRPPQPPPAAASPRATTAGPQAPAPAEPAPLAADGGVPEATGPVGPVPDRLRGVWEKTDQPFRGVRIEIGGSAGTGMAIVPVVAPPFDDAEAVAHFTQRNGNKKEIGEKFASCMPRIWKAGVPKYTELRPTARPDEWVGKSELRIVNIVTCVQARPKVQDVVLRLRSDDLLGATLVDPKSKVTQSESWKRVGP